MSEACYDVLSSKFVIHDEMSALPEDSREDPALFNLFSTGYLTETGFFQAPLPKVAEAVSKFATETGLTLESLNGFLTAIIDRKLTSELERSHLRAFMQREVASYCKEVGCPLPPIVLTVDVSQAFAEVTSLACLETKPLADVPVGEKIEEFAADTEAPLVPILSFELINAEGGPALVISKQTEDKRVNLGKPLYPRFTPTPGALVKLATVEVDSRQVEIAWLIESSSE